MELMESDIQPRDESSSVMTILQSIYIFEAEDKY